MDLALIEDVTLQNPWLSKSEPIQLSDPFIPRVQADYLLRKEWDTMCRILIGPRRAGKTTLGLHVSDTLVREKRADNLLYISCDFASVRSHFTSPAIVPKLIDRFKLSHPVVFIDEIQRLENPGLFLKSLFDLKLPMMLIASGSSQLELRSKVQEHLTGRELEAIVLPLSTEETSGVAGLTMEEQLIFGGYPAIVTSSEKSTLLENLYKRYIQKDIVEILRLEKPAVLEHLITLLAHSSGQLVNYNQLATDCGVSVHILKSYLHVLEQTFVVGSISPYVGNKRTEITSNPIYYFIDNGFRNQALRNFNSLNQRLDIGLLVENFVFSSLLKYKWQHVKDFDLHYWRTKSGAEVDFVLKLMGSEVIPIEVKYREFSKPAISRGYRSFLQAYQPRLGFYITKRFAGEAIFEGVRVYFVPIAMFSEVIELLG